MKLSAGTAVKGRGATAAHRAAPRRAAPAPAKAAQAAAVRKTAAPAKSAKPAADKRVKIVAKPAAKPPPPAKAAPEKPEARPAVVTPPAPVHSVQPKPPPAPHRPVPAAAAAVSPRPATPDRPPPRPMAKAEIFVEGDHVVYPTHGVGKVERIATEEIAGHKLELIHITFEENRMTLRVPVAKARTAGLRKLATRKLFDEALAVLKGRARIKRTMWSRRAQEYEAKINSGDPLAIAEVVRDLHRNAGQPDQSFSERQIYEAAMDRLAAELAALDKTDKLTAAGKLANFLKTV
jgi:CarD family transcriptional regulator